MNGNKVVSADIDASNGVVHILEGVLVPSWVFNTVTDRVVAANDLSTLLALIGIAEIAIPSPGELTLLAPTNAAFDQLPADVVEFLTSPEGKDTLVEILTYHVISGVYTFGELANRAELPTLEGRSVTVSVGETIKFNTATVVEGDILATNGVLHKIDEVLAFPTELRTGQESLLEFVTGNTALMALTTAVVRAGLVGALSGPGPFTLFAPNDDAFGAVPAELLELLLTNDEFIPHLQNLLLYHVLAGKIPSADLFDGLVAEPLNGETLLITLSPIAVNGNNVSAADNVVTNGVVHIIDGVLTPSWVFNSLTDRAAADSDLSVLVALMTIAGIDLTVPGELTLLAPSNAAFNKLPEDTVQFLVGPEGKDVLTKILKYHVLAGIFTSSELEDGAELVTLQGDTVTVSIDQTVSFNQAVVVAVDILSNNGVLHKIDDVLMPPVPPVLPSIAEFVAGNDDLTALTVAVVRANLFDALNTLSPLTLFAPTDEAFGFLPTDLLNTLLTNDEFIPHLQNLLLYHVFSGEVFASDLFEGLIAEAINGESVTITSPPLGVNGNTIINADNLASNGVVHLIGGVLAPSWVLNTLTDRVVSDSDLSTLLALVGIAEINLSVPGEFTLLAPTNDAFAKLPADVVEFLTSPEGKADLVNILAYHIFLGIYTSGELKEGAELPSLQGSDVVVTLNPVMFNQAGVVEVDILALNGVLHKIDDVLSPPQKSTVEFVATNPDLQALTAAVVRAGLVEALAAPGPFTLFAPSDDAFIAVPADLLELLFSNDEFIPHLRNLLLFHLLSGEFFAADLFDGLVADALNGEALTITLPPIAVNGNKVISADNEVSNGVVHIIDGVLTPSWIFNSIGDRVHSDGDLSVLQTLLTIAGIDLSIPGEFTLLAPTNLAFSLVPKDTIEFLVSPEGKDVLASVLKYHALLGVFTLDEFVEGTYGTLDGRNVSVTVDPIKFNCFD